MELPLRVCVLVCERVREPLSDGLCVCVVVWERVSELLGLTVRVGLLDDVAVPVPVPEPV